MRPGGLLAMLEREVVRPRRVPETPSLLDDRKLRECRLGRPPTGMLLGELRLKLAQADLIVWHDAPPFAPAFQVLNQAARAAARGDRRDWRACHLGRPP